MLADNDQFANFVEMNGLLDSDAVSRLRIQAELEEKPLYVTVIEKGAISEQKLVTMMSTLLGVPSVALAEFQGEPEVLGRISVRTIRARGVLPVGIDDGSGTAVLFVAMANPSETELLLALEEEAQMSVAPLLAGPVDLLAAIERNLGTLSQLMSSPSVRLSGAVPPISDAVDLLDDFEEGGVRSALGLLDDIPRNRHEQVTSPSGVIALNEMVGDDSGPVDSSLRPGLQLNRDAAPPPPIELGLSTIADEMAEHSSFGSAPHAAVDSNDVSGFVRFPAPGDPAPSQPIPRTSRAPLPPLGARGAKISAPAAPALADSVFPPFREQPQTGSQTGSGLPGGPGIALGGSGSIPAAPAVSSVGGAAPGLGAEDAMLLRALVGILTRRGLVTQREIDEEIARLRAGGT